MNSLNPNKKAFKVRKRKGRGIGSGIGKTAGRGLNGQRSRSGASIPAWFEGGQNPLYRRIPKRGFKNHFKTEYNEINISLLDNLAGSGKYAKEISLGITLELLAKMGFNDDKTRPVKILGTSAANAEVNNLKGKKLTAHKITGKAAEFLKSQGVEVEIIAFKNLRKRNTLKEETREKTES